MYNSISEVAGDILWRERIFYDEVVKYIRNDRQREMYRRNSWSWFQSWLEDPELASRLFFRESERKKRLNDIMHKIAYKG